MNSTIFLLRQQLRIGALLIFVITFIAPYQSKILEGKDFEIGKTDHVLHDVKLTTSRILFAARDLKVHAVV